VAVKYFSGFSQFLAEQELIKRSLRNSQLFDSVFFRNREGGGLTAPACRNTGFEIGFDWVCFTGGRMGGSFS